MAGGTAPAYLQVAWSYSCSSRANGSWRWLERGNVARYRYMGLQALLWRGLSWSHCLRAERADDWRRQQAWVKHRRQGTGVEGGFEVPLPASAARLAGRASYKHVQAAVAGACAQHSQCPNLQATGHLQQASRLFPTSQPLRLYSNNLIRCTTDRLQNMPGEKE